MLLITRSRSECRGFAVCKASIYIDIYNLRKRATQLCVDALVIAVSLIHLLVLLTRFHTLLDDALRALWGSSQHASSEVLRMLIFYRVTWIVLRNCMISDTSGALTQANRLCRYETMDERLAQHRKYAYQSYLSLAVAFEMRWVLLRGTWFLGRDGDLMGKYMTGEL